MPRRFAKVLVAPAVLVALGAGCSTRSGGAQFAGHAALDAGAGAPPAVAAEPTEGSSKPRPAEPWTIGGRYELCVWASGPGLWCGSPKVPRHGSGEPVAWTGVLASATNVVEALTRDIVRTKDGVVRTDVGEVARDVSSIAGYPYALRNDGRIVAIADQGSTELKVLRRDATALVPPAESVETTAFHTCARTRAGEAWCWIEPRFWFSAELEKGVPPKPARLVLPAGHTGKIVDLIVQPWLSACVRTESGEILCTATPATERCDLVGSTTLRCGNETKSTAAGDSVTGKTYDPRTVLARPLVPVGISEATTLVGFRRRLWSDHGTRSMVTTDYAEGGCARRRDGSIRCFVRDDCVPARPWRTFDVDGVPATGAITLTGDDGYVLDRGELSTWSRRVESCDTPPGPGWRVKATKKDFGARVVSVGGGVFNAAGDTVSVGIDCAGLENGDLRCWGHGAHPKIDVSFLR